MSAVEYMSNKNAPKVPAWLVGKQKTVQKKKALNKSVLFFEWLLDLGSNQGPTD
jgi:hypothetical protein